MKKKIFLFMLGISGHTFSMNSSQDHGFDRIDLNLIQHISRHERENRKNNRVTYCADLSTKQQIIVEKLTVGSRVEFCCALTMSNGQFFHSVPLNDQFFELLEAKYQEMH